MKRFTGSVLSSGVTCLLLTTGLALTQPTGSQKQTKSAAAKSKASAPKTTTQKPRTAAKSKSAGPATDAELNAQLESILKLASSERVPSLEEFIKKNPESSIVSRAQESLTSARAALGDEKLRSGDRLAGADLFRLAVAEAPAAMPDKLYFEVVSQLPANLYLLGEQEAGLELARQLEGKVKDNARRLLPIAGFYLSLERADDAARVAAAAVAAQPDLAAAHQALGLAHRFALRLDEAAAEFAKAKELEPGSSSARRTLADLFRAIGKTEDALALYREQLRADPKDVGARNGLILSLFDAGKREEAETALTAALAKDPANLPLLVGASYWYSANNEGVRAQELAERAVALEPRFRWVWARIALARALLTQARPLDAERALRPAREMGRFATLDYELASILVSAGLYDEAAQELEKSFNISDGQIEALLAGRFHARAESFGELLSPERRAGLFQFRSGDNEDISRQLKALLAFYRATKPGDAPRPEMEKLATDAASEFVKGDDPMRSFRQLYVANRLTQRGTGLRLALDVTEAAKRGLEAALDVPYASVALFADELYDVRSRAIAQGMTTTVPDASRDVLSKVMRGRIEDLAGWALFNQGQAGDAVVRLRRAVSVLPENTIWWKTAQWRLGAALDSSGNPTEALTAYVKSFKLGAPDAVRYAVIEALYRRINGSTQGLDRLLAAPLSSLASTRPSTNATQPAASSTEVTTPVGQPTSDSPSAVPVAAPATPSVDSSQPTGAVALRSAETTPSPTPSPEPSPISPPVAAGETTDPRPAPAVPAASETSEPSPTRSPTPTPEAPTPTPTASPTPESATAPIPVESPAPSPAAATESTTEVAPTPTPTPITEGRKGENAASTPESSSPGPARASRARRASGTAQGCVMNVSESAINVNASGGSTSLAVTFEKYNGATPPRIKTATPNWADITVFGEPKSVEDPNTMRFSVSSSSGKAGTYLLKLSSPCGVQDVTVTVK